MWSGMAPSVAAAGMPCSRSESMLGSAGPSSPESSGSTVLSTKGDSGAGGGGSDGAVPQHLRDHDRIGQYRIDAVPDPCGQSIDVGGWSAARRTPRPERCRRTAAPRRRTPGQASRQGRGGVRARGHGRQVDRRHLGQMGQRPDHDSREGQLPADQQLGQRLAGGLGLRHQGARLARLVAALDQCLGQTGGPLDARLAVTGLMRPPGALPRAWSHPRWPCGFRSDAG